MQLDPFSNDPVYDAIRASARARRRQETRGMASNVNIEVNQSIGDGGDGPGADTGVNIKGPVSVATPGMVTPQATYGVTPGYSVAQRAGEAVGANMPAIAASVALGRADPLKGAAIGVGIDTLLGNAPSYVRGPSMEGGARTQISGFDPTKTYGQFPDGRIAEVTAEDLVNPDIKSITAAEAARINPVGYVGADPRTPLGAVALGFQTLATSLVPFSGVMFGPVVESPVGTKMALGSTPFGGMITNEVYQTTANVRNNMTGNFGMQIGNQYATYRATEGPFGIQQARVAGMNLSKEQFESLYGANLGYDPRSVDWANSTPNNMIGEQLEGFAPGAGGFAKDGTFIDSRGGMKTSLTKAELNSYMDVASRNPNSARAASEALAKKAEMVKDDFFFAEAKHKTYAEAAAKMQSRARAVEAQINRSGASLGFTGTSPEAETTRSIADDLTRGLGIDVAGTGDLYRDMVVDQRFEGATPAEMDYQSWAFDGGSDGGGGISTVEGYTTVSGRDDGGGSDSSNTGGGFSPGFDDGDVGGMDSSGTYFAEGGFVQKKAEGGPAEQGATGPVGFVNGKTPEQVSPEKTIADDVEGQVPEGTFVINAAAVERAGSADIRRMLLKAIEEAERQGIDLSAGDITMDSEDAVSVAVSEGEVLVPPVLARIIGYDRLEKINKRGEAEVARRQQEAEEQQQTTAPMAAAEGGFIVKKSDGGIVSSLYKAIPTNVRLLGEFIAGKDSPITEKDFSEEELKAMSDAVERAKSRNAEHEAELRRRIDAGTPFVAEEDGRTGHIIYRDYRGKIVPQQMLRHMDDPEFQKEALEVLRNQLKTYENTRDKTSVRNYYVNEVANPGGAMELLKILNNPVYQLQTTLGEYRATENSEGMVVDDEYNFNTRELREMIGKDEVELIDIFKNLDTPQLAAELFARYVQPKHTRDVNIKIPKSGSGFIDTPPEFE